MLCFQQRRDFRMFTSRRLACLAVIALMLCLCSTLTLMPLGGTPRAHAASGNGTHVNQASQAALGPLVLAIDAGGGATGSFVADTDYNTGNEYSDTSTSINTSGVSNPAPQSVWQTCRWNSAFTYTIPGLTAGVTYTVQLDWAELTWTAVGQRVFNVAINGTTVLSNFDVYAQVGYKTALAKQFTVAANSSGQIVIAFTKGSADNPFISGVEIYQPGSTTPTPTPTTPTKGTLVTAINAGGSATGSFVADTDYNTGNEYSDTSTSINTSSVSESIPQSVWQTCRWNSSFAYTIPGLTAGTTYTVALDWAELTWTAVGQRIFNVAIDGTTVLSNFDVYAQAGYKTALQKLFSATANSSGQIVISFMQGSADNPFISAIELYLPGSSTPTATATPMHTPTPTPTVGVTPTATATPAGNGAVPAQFIAKLYTEGLGRAPDQASWAADVSYFQANGCNASTLSTVGQQVYNSTEFTSDYSDNAARVLTLYRGALNRDPDQGGLNGYISSLNGGTSWSTVVNAIFTSTEFNNLVATICNTSAPNYHFGSQTPPTLPTGSTGYTGSESGLQSALNSVGSGGTVYLAQKAVIGITTTLVVPSGVTLATAGTPGTTHYALMGRLVRTSSFQGAVVNIDGGGIVTSVWIDGQRNVLGYEKFSGGVGDNADIVSLGGTGTTVTSNKLSDPQGGTDFYSAGKGDGYACSHETITGNLITAYSANHGYSDNSDGLTMRCENLDIENNQIVDATDIGIVLFATNGTTQASTIKNNIIVSAGNSMNAPVSADPTTGGNTPGSTLDYSQTTFSTNTFWTGPNTTFDFGLVAGAREWFSSGTATNGTGATYTNNTTGSLSARVRAGIAIAGMLNVSITNDSSHPMSFILVTFASGQPAANCPGANVIAEVAEGNASGTFPTPYYDSDFDGCI